MVLVKMMLVVNGNVRDRIEVSKNGKYFSITTTRRGQITTFERNGKSCQKVGERFLRKSAVIIGADFNDPEVEILTEDLLLQAA